MSIFRSASLAAGLSLALMACAGTPADHSAHRGDGNSAPGAMGQGMAPGSMTLMDEQMKRMHDMHEKMMQAKTPEERSALMSEHMKAMHDGMAAMRGMGGMGGMAGNSDQPDAMPMHHQMMAKRMDMMQSMMEMMMDRIPAAAPAAK